ncbi:MAG: four helix bundle protein [Salinivirgaceae bacterium]
MERKNEILEVSFEFALMVIEFSELLELKGKYVIARQVLKSGTSIGANIRESQSAEGKADFIHKLKIAHKEAEETQYWPLLCEKAPSYASPPDQMMAALLSIQKLLSKIISSSKK